MKHGYKVDIVLDIVSGGRDTVYDYAADITRYYLSRDVIIVKIYFAHSIKQYNTFFEKKCLKLIRERFPHGEIINPATLYLGYMEEFLSVVEQCDIIVFTRWHGYITSGVAKEVEHALRLNKKVYEIRKGEMIEIKRMPSEKVLDYEDTILAYRDPMFLELLDFLEE